MKKRFLILISSPSHLHGKRAELSLFLPVFAPQPVAQRGLTVAPIQFCECSTEPEAFLAVRRYAVHLRGSDSTEHSADGQTWSFFVADVCGLDLHVRPTFDGCTGIAYLGLYFLLRLTLPLSCTLSPAVKLFRHGGQSWVHTCHSMVLGP
ncbi:hypothetical protein DFH08DRAFT_437633 [Mycena albidolilacea]|uniref:Uncharacterized protein n=1 Tax=Mycena albidolilacea TaxID=1033008 RepID=A0AAD7AG35_9AGAR|nr:hypothetical protein DFH08DRAFT_437633 [Mycena albidolilacea]